MLRKVKRAKEEVALCLELLYVAGTKTIWINPDNEPKNTFFIDIYPHVKDNLLFVMSESVDLFVLYFLYFDFVRRVFVNRLLKAIVLLVLVTNSCVVEFLLCCVCACVLV